MSDLVVIAYPSAEAAFAARAEFAALQREYLVEMEDVVVVTRSEAGDVQLHQAVNLTALGAASGTLWGSLIGLLFLNPLLGAAVGAASGAVGGSLADLGIDDELLRGTGGALDMGGAALAILLRKLTADRVADRLGALGGGGRLVQSSLPADIEDRLRVRLEAPPAPGGPAAPALAGAPAAAPAAAAATPPGNPGALTQP